LFDRAGPGKAIADRIMDSLMRSLLWLFDTLIQLYVWVLVANAVLSWLVAFNVVNVRNPFVAQVGEFLYRVTEPALRPIRRFLPNLGGIDISPVILIILLLFVRHLVFEVFT
jgi:YggT family protein